MNADWTPRRRKRRTFGAPGAIALVVLVVAAGAAVWLALAPSATRPGVVLALNLPTEAKMTLAPPAGEPLDAAPAPVIEPTAGPREIAPEVAIAAIEPPAAPAAEADAATAAIPEPAVEIPPAPEAAAIASPTPTPAVESQATDIAAAIPEPAPAPAATVIAAAEPQPEPGTAAAAPVVPEPEAVPDPVAATTTALEPEPQPFAREAPEPQPAPAAAVIAAATPEPEPEAAAAATVIPVPEAAAEPAAGAVPGPAPEPVTDAIVTPGRAPEPAAVPGAALAAVPPPEPEADEEAAVAADLAWGEPEPAVEPVAITAPTPEAEATPVPTAIATAAPEPTPEPGAAATPEQRIEQAPTLDLAPEIAATAPAAGPPEEVTAAPRPRVAASQRLEAAPPEEAPMVTAALAPEGSLAAPPPAAGAVLPADAFPETKMPPPATADAGARVRETWIAYARPFDPPPGRPLIAVVVTGLGLSQASTAAAIRLPSAVTLGFSSYARDLQEWIDLARASGHEVMLDLPMEPVDYPAIDPGPQALLTSLTAAENADRLEWHLARATGYIGVTHNMGSRFTASPDDLRPVLSTIKGRGLMFLDSRTSSASVGAELAVKMELPRAANDRFLDAQASRPAIDRRLGEIERIARRTGYSVTVGHAFPVTLDRLAEWLETFDEKGLALAPISAVVNKQNLK